MGKEPAVIWKDRAGVPDFCKEGKGCVHLVRVNPGTVLGPYKCIWKQCKLFWAIWHRKRERAELGELAGGKKITIGGY